MYRYKPYIKTLVFNKMFTDLVLDLTITYESSKNNNRADGVWAG